MAIVDFPGNPAIGVQGGASWDMDLGKPHMDINIEPPNDLARYKDDLVNHPPHYKSHPSGIECIEVVRHMPYNVGVAVAYVWRHKLKGGKEDIRKAIWHLEDYLRHYPDDKAS